MPNEDDFDIDINSLTIEQINEIYGNILEISTGNELIGDTCSRASRVSKYYTINT